tara:strand:- start:820 stop:1122 length:303 start_codon:yes stop_codon:yes gene_type:complete
LRLLHPKKKRKNLSPKIRVPRKQKEFLNSQMVDGNALNAKTTTSKEERTAIDAKNQELLRIYQASQLISKKSKKNRPQCLILILMRKICNLRLYHRNSRI